MGELTKIGDILQQLLYPTPQELQAQRHQEQAYRRGYHHAWNEALETVFALLRDGEDLATVMHLAAQHEHRIAAWRNAHDFTMLPPPAFRRLYVAEATLEGE